MAAHAARCPPAEWPIVTTRVRSSGVAAQLLDGTPETVPDRYAAASPAARLPLGVPALLTHGGQDDIVPPAMSEEFHAAALAAGDDCALVVVPEEDHFSHLDPASRVWAAAVEWIR